MKKLQVKINKLYAIDVKDDFDFTDELAISILMEKELAGNNTTASNEFYENIEVVCSDCGISLKLDEEKEAGKCLQCQNN